MSLPRTQMQTLNGKRPSMQRMQQDLVPNQHDDLIKYIYESFWTSELLEALRRLQHAAYNASIRTVQENPGMTVGNLLQNIPPPDPSLTDVWTPAMSEAVRVLVEGAGLEHRMAASVVDAGQGNSSTFANPSTGIHYGGGMSPQHRAAENDTAGLGPFTSTSRQADINFQIVNPESVLLPRHLRAQGSRSQIQEQAEDMLHERREPLPEREAAMNAAWNKISREFESFHQNGADNSKGSPSVVYYSEEEPNPHLKDFEPFDLEAWWGKRMVQSITRTQS